MSAVVKPLKTVDELLSWDKNVMSEDFYDSLPSLPSNFQWLPERRRTLVCHDFKGGYGNDNVPIDSQNEAYDFTNDYLFFHWDRCDLFVYFSHQFITIPPHGWICAAHRNSTPILGTLITEHDEGYKNCCDFLNSKEVADRVADQLVTIAKCFKLQGWLINIENKIPVEQLPLLVEWLRTLRDKLHQSIPQSHLMWYDSVRADNGKLDWQNELNSVNKPFYLACDSIYLNYTWNEEKIAISKINSTCEQIEGSRDHVSATGFEKCSTDVFVGLDVFGRGCFGGGQFCSDKAVEVCEKLDMSLAIFAPGWSLECCSSGDSYSQDSFLKRDRLLWQPMCSHLPEPNPLCVELPFETNFNFGLRTRSCEKSDELFYCLSDTQALPVNALERFISNVSYDKSNAHEGLTLAMSDFDKKEELQILNLKCTQIERLTFSLSYKQLLSRNTCTVSAELFAQIHSNDDLTCTLRIRIQGVPDGENLVDSEPSLKVTPVHAEVKNSSGFNFNHVCVLVKLVEVEDSMKEQIGLQRAFVRIKSVRVC